MRLSAEEVATGLCCAEGMEEAKFVSKDSLFGGEVGVESVLVVVFSAK